MRHIRYVLYHCFALVLCCSATPVNAIYIDYDASVMPNNHTDPFSYVEFSSTSGSVSGGELTLTTAPAEGIWFGKYNHPSFAVPWNLAPSSDGNYLSVTAKLAPLATEWSMYFYDGAHFAGLGLIDNHTIEITKYHTPTGNLETQLIAVDTTEYHQYELLLKDGLVTYRLDGSTVLYHGDAYPTTFSNTLVIGDGSGSMISGTGSMMIDHVVFQTSPDFMIVPEPALFSVLLCVGSLLLVQRRV
ncbi:hypothetical protein KS4_29520 [Poriferisphaera corsica]|uniref:PEP-CTERM protein-sorting domain-containing protein n=1 Tax=Poriferisphaera corsica TaxID=2528020 RepID=A0A517YXC5_9BACT|nr:hypothetical protein [Poriferisphaera corsica]QDU34876.1 hypothetical protein KS4_29520 [Poriferisphaera corsica]